MLEQLDNCLSFFSSIFVDISWVRYGDNKIVFDDDIIVTIKDGNYLLDSEYFDETINGGKDPIAVAVDLVEFVVGARLSGLEEHLREQITKSEEEEKPAPKLDKFRKHNKL